MVVLVNPQKVGVCAFDVTAGLGGFRLIGKKKKIDHWYKKKHKLPQSQED